MSGSRPRTVTTSRWLIPTWLWARLSTSVIILGSQPIRPSVSSPSFVFFSDSASSMPDHDEVGLASIVAITSAVKPGGVSTITTSNVERATRRRRGSARP